MTPGTAAGRLGRLIRTGLRGRTVLVTGGAGNIGAAIGRAFAAEGARVLDRDPVPPEGTNGRTSRPRPTPRPASPRSDWSPP